MAFCSIDISDCWSDLHGGDGLRLVIESHRCYSQPVYSPLRRGQDYSLLTPLQRIRGLDRPSPRFYDRLSAILGEDEFKKCIANLQGDDSRWLIEHLDSVLSECPVEDANYRVFLRALRRICGASGSLPESHMLSFKDSDPLTVPVRYSRQFDCQVIMDDRRYAIKRLRVYSDSDLPEITKRFCNEVMMWKRLSHPNIFPVKWVDVEHFKLFSEWMDNGNIIEYVARHPGANRLKLLFDVAKGLEYLHSLDIVHGNVKGANVLVDEDGQARISDYGHSAIIHGEESTTPLGGPRWIAPELLQGRGIINKGTDVYAFGMLAFEVLAGAPPFIGIPPTAVAIQVLSSKRPKRPKLPSLTDESWGMIERCWAQGSSLRPEIGEVVHLLRRASMAQQDLMDPSSFLVEDGPIFGIFLRKVVRCAGRVSSSLRRFFLSLSESQLKPSPPDLSDYGMKTKLSGSCTSIGSFQEYGRGFAKYQPSETCEG